MSESLVWVIYETPNPGQVELIEFLSRNDPGNFRHEILPGAVRVGVPDLHVAAWVVERLGWLAAAQKILEHMYRKPSATSLNPRGDDAC